MHTPRHSGAEILVRDLCLAHAEMGAVCAMSSFGQSTDEFLPEVEKLKKSGTIVYFPSNINKGLSRTIHYMRSIQDFRPDIVFAHSVLPSIYGRIAMLLSGARAKFVPVLHSGSDDYKDLKLRLCENLLSSKADTIVAVSESAAGDYNERIKRKRPVVIIRNGVDLNRFYAARHQREDVRRSLGLVEGERLFLQVGRITSVKRQIFSLQSMSKAIKADENITLWFAGIVEDAEYYRKFISEIGRLSLCNRVKFLGPREDIPELLSACDVYLMPSASEAHSVAFLEAMASGVPIVASNIKSFQFAKAMPGVDLIDIEAELGARDFSEAALRARGRFNHNMNEFDLQSTAESYISLGHKLLFSARD